MRIFIRGLVRWLPLGLAVTMVLLTVSIVTQQTYRTGADDPQVQMARDAARAIDAGADPATVVGSGTVDPTVSLAPFLIVYNASGSPVAGSGKIGGTIPTPPAGVLSATVAVGTNRVTWQPDAQTRIASVEVATKNGGVVLAGRSLQEVEAREDRLTQSMALAWVGTMLATLAAVVAVVWLEDRRALPVA
jgi:hypothetical protein